MGPLCPCPHSKKPPLMVINSGTLSSPYKSPPATAISRIRFSPCRAPAGAD
ncbi:unnamed protein product [Staurois parvus]|uniref:Uncharacterized protein n=1 Tax=Staurois parvus TaxID=386267 RepID=A0ABN9HIM2_9NEOB|nr:unnamed protein product [Staurois parvus]